MSIPCSRPAAALAVAVLAIGFCARAGAAEYGFYVAGYYGTADKQVVKSAHDSFANSIYDAFGFAPEQTVSTLDDGKDKSFGMAAGYRLLEHLAIEAGYMDLGSVGYRNDSFGTNLIVEVQEPWQQRLESSTTGIAISALGILPLSDRWELYGRAGALIASNEVDVFITDFFGSASRTLSDSSFELLAGVGLSMSFAEVYGLRLEYQRVFDAGEEPAEGDVDVASLGFTVSF
jgi:OOP family OmpA-OmpF porin